VIRADERPELHRLAGLHDGARRIDALHDGEPVLLHRGDLEVHRSDHRMLPSVLKHRGEKTLHVTRQGGGRGLAPGHLGIEVLEHQVGMSSQADGTRQRERHLVRVVGGVDKAGGGEQTDQQRCEDLVSTTS
jgi:hypothetical protein